MDSLITVKPFPRKSLSTPLSNRNSTDIPMVFSSTIFLFLFRPVALAVSLVLRGKPRNAFLVSASLAFYGWEWDSCAAEAR